VISSGERAGRGIRVYTRMTGSAFLALMVWRRLERLTGRRSTKFDLNYGSEVTLFQRTAGPQPPCVR
jgi:hypothetical protein